MFQYHYLCKLNDGTHLTLYRQGNDDAVSYLISCIFTTNYIKLFNSFAKVLKNPQFFVILRPYLTKVDFRHDSTNHASMFLDEPSGKAERVLAAHCTLRAKKRLTALVDAVSPLVLESVISFSECDWAVAHAARSAEGSQGCREDAHGDLDNGLPSFFLHSALFLMVNVTDSIILARIPRIYTAFLLA